MNIHELTPNNVLSVMKRATIGIAGIGGLGSHVAVALVRTGLGKLICADFDVVEPSNINRQYYFLDQIGMPKTDALRATLRRIAPQTELMMHNTRVTEENAAGLFAGCDVLIECFDNPITKADLFATWVTDLQDMYYIGSSGVAGYRDEPPIKIIEVGSHVFIVGDLETDVAQAGGLTATRVGIAAHMQANLAVNLLMGR